MKEIILILIALVIACVIFFAIGYDAGYQYVIHNQYAEECEHSDNCYHIVIDGNAYEYEFDKE